MLDAEEAKARLEAIRDLEWRQAATSRVGKLKRRWRGASVLLELPHGLDVERRADLDRRRLELAALLDGLSERERATVLGALHPQLGLALARWWEAAAAQPYQTGWTRRGFRAPDHPGLTRTARLLALDRLLVATGPFDRNPLWIASWAGHLGGAHFGPLLAAEIDAGGEEGEAILATLFAAARGEAEVATMGRHVIVALLRCGRPEAWELVVRLLVAAQREEGLRQSILEAADEGRPAAFDLVLGAVVEHDLLRFAAAVRAAGVWLGLAADVGDIPLLRERVDLLRACRLDPRACAEALACGDGLRAYTALCAIAQRNVVEALAAADGCAGALEPGVRAAAARFFAASGLSGGADRIPALLADPDLAVAAVAAGSLDPRRLARTPAAFELVEAYGLRLPERPTTAPPIGIESEPIPLARAQAADLLLASLGERPIDRLLPWVAAMDPSARARLARRAGDAERLSPPVRAVLVAMVGDRSAGVRSAAVAAMDGLDLDPDEVPVLEALLTRKAGDLRRGVLGLLGRQGEAGAVRSALRLWDAADPAQREAACELLGVVGDGSSAARRAAAAFVASGATPRHRELLGSLAGAAEVPGSDDPGLGLLDRRQLRPVSAPVASGRHLGGADPVARAISALDDLAEAHRDVQVTVSTWQGASEVLLADLRFAPSPFHRRGSGGDADGGAGLLLPDVFGTWWEGRPPDCRHDPATDALHGLLAVRNVTDRRHAPGRAPSGWLDAAMAAEAGAPVGQLRHPALVRHVLEWMLVRDVRPATIDACLDGASNVFAAVPRQALEDLPEEGAPSNQRWAQDWRVHQRRLGTWGELLEGLRSLRPDVVSAAHLERWFQLMRWFDQPRPGVVRVPVPQALLLAAHAAGVASDADVLEALMQPRTRLLSDLSRWRRHQHEERNPGAVALADRVRQRVLAIEVHRGDLPTAASALALRLRSVEGVSTTAAVLGSLGAAALQRGWSADGISRQAVFSHLLRVSRPAEADRADDLVAAARDAGVRDRRLLELAVYAPQWAALVEQALGWPGLEDGVWWFHAHTKDDRWSVDADVRESWAARSAERTPLGADDLVAGGVDVAWFLRSHAELGEARWKQLHAAAKFASGGGGHRRAQLFAEAMLGLADEGALEGRIRTKRHQDSVRALGLLPLPAAEPDRAEASMRRYGTLREFERGAAKFGSMRQASERGAVRIGIENLARTAGSPDPQQFAWAMEAAEAGALADGPITVAEDDVAVTLSISPDGLAEIGVVRGNKALKAVPASHRKRPAIAELVARRTALARQARRVRASLEASMVRQDRFRTEDLVALDRHPVVAPMLELLVFVDEAGRTARRRAGQLIDAYGAELVPTGTLRIAHPVDLAGGGDWVRWQEQLYAEEARQPCKQVFRELYVVTAAERDGGPISHRYDGHQVQPRQALALLGSRGWLADRESGEVSRVFHDHGMVARLELLDGFGTPADVELPTISGIGFTERGSYLAQPLGSVAPVVLSEAMRDLDLVVSVAHAGAVDPEATASTVDVRAALVREAARTLRLDNVREVGSHVVIQGKLGEYSVHLGSGVVHRRPGGEVCIIPVDSQRRGRVFLPFADDDPKTAEVVAKVLLLARDHQIKDPSILEQLRT